MGFFDILSKRKKEIVKQEIIENEKDINKKDFYSLLNNNRMGVEEWGSNCIGTALYLVGEKDKDEYIWTGKEDIFNALAKSDKPEVGYIAGWINNKNDIVHVAVITNLNPLTVSTRNGTSGVFYSERGFNKVFNLYSSNYDFKEVKYFIPSKLQKILDKGGTKLK